MARFMRARGFSDYDELWRWSVEDLDGFWGALWDWFEIDGSYDRVLGSRDMPGAEWFPGSSLNYAERLFQAARPGEVAIVHASESQPLAELTWADFMVLAVVSALDGPCQEAIHNRVAVDRGSLSRLVRDLEYEGLIERALARPA